jgi:hypothetical protein
MKKLLIIPIAFALSFCNCNKKAVEEKPLAAAITTMSVCPEDGDCTIQLLKNKRMVLKNDGIGKLYYETEDDANKSVVIYEYKRRVEPGLQDGSHREEVIFEIDNNASELSLSDRDLQQTQMLFGRHCFCRGQAGYYRISSGKLNLINKDDKITFNLDFKIAEVPQTINNIQTSVK